MNWTAFGIIGTLLWSLQLALYCAWLFRRNHSRATPVQPARGRKVSLAQKANRIVFAVFAVVATVEAQKNTSTNEPPPRLASPRSGSPAEATVNAQDILRGYRLECEQVDETFSFTMPTGAVPVGKWHVHGAASPFGKHVVDLDGFAFPLGAGYESYARLWYSTDASLRPTPHDSTREIKALDQNLFAMEGMSRLWHLAHDDSYTICWEALFATDDATAPVNAAITLFPNGDFSTRSNASLRVYRRINPDDWDGDGLANAIDAEPAIHNGDLYGTCEAWYNSACASVLEAATDTNGEVSVEWHDGVCADAYYWLTFSSSQGPNRIDVICDGASDLGDLTVIAASNQTCRVPLLIGAEYHVTAQYELEDIDASDAEADIRLSDAAPSMRSFPSIPRSIQPHRGESRTSRDFWIVRPIELGLDGEYPDYTLTTTPFVDASVSSATGGCCSISLSHSNMFWTCETTCSCSGFYHPICAAATWEGYTKSFSWECSCGCQEDKKHDPYAWFRTSAPRLLIKDGNPHTVAAILETPCETNAIVEIACIAGGDKLQVVSSNESSMVVRGIEKSGIDAVWFETRLAIDGSVYCKTQSLTVAEVKCLHMTSTAGQGSVSPPPFPGGEENPFSPYAPGPPGKHLLIPFDRVVDSTDFSINDFHVDLSLELDPDIGASSDAVTTWSIEENTIQSGNFAVLDGMSARFSNPKRGGIVRFSATCDGSPATKGTLLLPLAGASIDGVFIEDFFASRRAGLRFENSWCRYLLTPIWGAWCFYFNGNGDYVGRVDSAERPTVWRYNQINDNNGLGAVATLNGLPIRTSKLSNFLVSTTTTSIDVNEMLRRMSTFLGTGDDQAAAISWNTGAYVATNGNFLAATAVMSTNAWYVADEKVRRLWPNPAPTDNHLPMKQIQDFNYNFCSPGFVEKWGGLEE